MSELADTFTWLHLVRWLHIFGATVLFGTGAGIAFFMLLGHRSAVAGHIARTARTVVIADAIFTATAVVAQPITGAILAHMTGWSLLEPWIVLSLGLYVLTGVFWLPVVVIQHRLWKLAEAAYTAGTPLPERYHRLFAIWFACGFPAFFAVIAILWLMVTRPVW